MITYIVVYEQKEKREKRRRERERGEEEGGDCSWSLNGSLPED